MIYATATAIPLAAIAALLLYGYGSPTSDTAEATESARPQATGPVSMIAPNIPSAAADVCKRLVSALPVALRDRQRRPVTAGPEQNAAYGDPPITLTCGVSPAAFPSTDQLWRLDAVCWHHRDDGDATVWTTVDRQVPVQVRLPRKYEPATQWTIGFSSSVSTSVPTLPAVPSGCRPNVTS
ncbi:DUF3515 family protein [Asanoa ferruginea]